MSPTFCCLSVYIGACRACKYLQRFRAIRSRNVIYALYWPKNGTCFISPVCFLREVGGQSFGGDVQLCRMFFGVYFVWTSSPRVVTGDWFHFLRPCFLRYRRPIEQLSHEWDFRVMCGLFWQRICLVSEAYQICLAGSLPSFASCA